jgi:DNA-binding NtrC family response regulator
VSDWSSTLDVPDSGSDDRAAPEVMALVIAWAAAEPDRVGEVALFEDSEPRILGRGREAGEPVGRRVTFVRQRPAVSDPRPPLSGRGLSREQIRVVARDGRIVVENIGRCPMSCAGEAVQRCALKPGDTLLLKNQLLLLCARRPWEMRLLRDFPASAVGAFGEPDAMGIVGESPAVWRLRDRIAWNAKAGRHVLILGESGTGKELAARALHTLSPLSGRRFVARNAATIPAGLVDAELFGNVKGYPHAGMPERAGLVGEADGGTLFLDEIGELPPSLHANLLRVLDGGEYHRLGGSSARRADLRLIAATNRDPGALKHDLLARLTLRFTMPSLADRREDVPLLIRHLLRAALSRSPEITRRFAAEGGARPELRVAPELIEDLLHRRLDTHVRGLDAVLWRAMSASPGDTIRDVQDSLQVDAPSPSAGAPVSDDVAGDEPATSYEEPAPERIRACLAEHGGNVSRAARALDLPSRYVLYRLLRKHGIVVDVARGRSDG